MTILGGVVVPGITSKGWINSAELTAINVEADSAAAMTVEQNGGNYVFQVDTSTTDAATGIKITGAAEGDEVAVAVISSGTNENLTLDAKGSGTVTINGTATGAIYLGAATTITGATGITGAATVTSTSASALTVGANGATNPVLKVDANTASVATGLSITGAAAASGLAVAVVSSGTDEALTVNAKGAGAITLGGVSTGDVTLGHASNNYANFARTKIADGTGASAVIGAIGGTGRPQTAAQDGWLAVKVAGTAKWIPVWA